jgi:rhamnogalacturonyl hydrolase YesR
VYYEGLMALYGIDRDARYYNYAVRGGTSHGWALNTGSATRHADNQCIGQVYLDLYALDPKPERIRDLQTNLAAMVNSTGNDDWWWCDALQMAMPVFARLGVLNHDPRYFDKMYALYLDAKTHQGGTGLYNPVEHLWWRDRNFLPPYREPNGSNCYWSRGNGWVLVALARVLDVLPADEAHRAEYVRTFQEMAAAIKSQQRPDGFWNVSLLDPGHFGGKEVSGTSLFVCGFASGVRQGLLPAADYEPAIARGWNAMASEAVHQDGALGYMQGVGKQPSDSQPVSYDRVPEIEDFGVGCFLLAGAEVWQLAGSK